MRMHVALAGLSICGRVATCRKYSRPLPSSTRVSISRSLCSAITLHGQGDRSLHCEGILAVPIQPIGIIDFPETVVGNIEKVKSIRTDAKVYHGCQSCANVDQPLKEQEREQTDCQRRNGAGTLHSMFSPPCIDATCRLSVFAVPHRGTSTIPRVCCSSIKMLLTSAAHACALRFKYVGV